MQQQEATIALSFPWSSYRRQPTCRPDQLIGLSDADSRTAGMDRSMDGPERKAPDLAQWT